MDSSAGSAHRRLSGARWTAAGQMQADQERDFFANASSAARYSSQRSARRGMGSRAAALPNAPACGTACETTTVEIACLKISCS